MRENQATRRSTSARRVGGWRPGGYRSSASGPAG